MQFGVRTLGTAQLHSGGNALNRQVKKGAIHSMVRFSSYPELALVWIGCRALAHRLVQTGIGTLGRA